MIAKKVTKKRGSKSDFKNLVGYLMRDHKPDEQIEYSRISNCGFDTIGLATKEILATQSRNTRSKADKTCHLVVSFQAGEHPTEEQLIDIEDEISKSLGYSDHQRISVLHTDTDNVHLHIAINKIHPTTHKSIELLRDHYRLSEACELLEERHGLQKDNRARDRDQSQSVVPGKAGDLESHSGVDSFKRWINERKPVFNDVLEASTSWEDLHQGLAAFDVVLRERGAGLVISAQSAKAFTKASDLGRSFSKGQLESRFGPFVRSNAKEVKPKEKYTKPPKQTSQRRAGLWDQYQYYKANTAAHKREILKLLSVERGAKFGDYKQRRDAKRREIFGDALLSSKQKRQVYRAVLQDFRAQSSELRLEFKHKRAEIHRQHPLLSWQTWLIQQATDGSDEALKTLRTAIRKPIKGAEKMAFLGESSELSASKLKPVIRANGDALYTIQGSTVRDTGDQLRMTIHQRDDLIAAVALARKKYGDHLKIDGDEAFKQAVVEVCVQTNQKVTFEDAALERRRQILQDVKEAHRQKTTLLTWIEQENKTNEKNNDIMVFRSFAKDDKGSAEFRGIRHLNKDLSVALYRKNNEVLAVPLSHQESSQLKQYRIGTQVVLDSNGHAKAQSRGHGR